MGLINVNVYGEWEDIENFLRKQKEKKIVSILEKYGREGVAILSSVTPIDTGVSASSWFYEIIQNEKGISIVFRNNSTTYEGTPIVVLLQYGHGNGNGGYIQGRDYINPAIQPVFDKMIIEAWQEVCK